MPNDRWTAAYREALATTPSDDIILHTLEVWHPDVNVGPEPSLDIAILVDDTGSMTTPIADLKTNFAQLNTDLATAFPGGVRYSVWRFKDDPDVEELTTGWATYAEANTQIQALVAADGGGVDESGYLAIKTAAESLTWSNAGATKIVLVATDTNSNTDGASQAEAQTAITNDELHLVYGGTSLFTDTSYTGLSPSSTFANFLDIDADWLALIEAVDVIGQANTYLVQDRVDHDLPLELGGDPVTFEASSFRFSLPAAGVGGLQELQLAIANTDLRISQFIKDVLEYDQNPVHVIYRPYLTSDTTQPQIDPPLELFLTDLTIDRDKVAGRATFSDVINRRFPSELYTRLRFPGLGP